MRKMLNFSTLLLQNSNDTVIGNFIDVAMIALVWGRDLLMPLHYLLYVALFFYFFVIKNGFNLGYKTLHNSLEFTYEKQVNSFYLSTFRLPIFMLSLFVLGLMLGKYTSSEVIAGSIQFLFLFVPFMMLSLIQFVKGIPEKILVLVLTIGLNGTLYWLFFHNMKVVENQMVFQIAEWTINLNYWSVLLVVVLYFLLIVFVVSKIALKLYRPKLPGGVE